MNNLNRNIYNVYRDRSIDMNVTQKFDIAQPYQRDIRSEYKEVYELNKRLKIRLNEIGGNASIFPNASTNPSQPSFSLGDMQMLMDQNDYIMRLLNGSQ